MITLLEFVFVWVIFSHIKKSLADQCVKFNSIEFKINSNINYTGWFFFMYFKVE